MDPIQQKMIALFRLLLSLFCIAALLPRSPAAAYRLNEVNWRIAMVVGNSAYQHSPIPHAVQDALDMADRLRQINFSVLRRTDASKEEILAACGEFKRRMQGGKIGLFYYTGHGIQYGGRNYLVPLSADIKAAAEIPQQCIPLADILQLMAAADNETNVVMIDASYGKPFGYRLLPDQAGLTTPKPPVDFIISLSNLPDHVSDKVAARNGIYTAHALENMLRQEDEIEMFCKRLRIDVAADTAGGQIPYEISTLQNEFFMNPPRTFLKLKMKKKRAFSSDQPKESEP